VNLSNIVDTPQAHVFWCAYVEVTISECRYARVRRRRTAPASGPRARDRTGTPHPRTPQNPTNSARIRLNGCGVRHFLRRCRPLTTLDTDGAKAYRFSIVAIFDMEDAVAREGLTP
jgi:hypothetical protein